VAPRTSVERGGEHIKFRHRPCRELNSGHAAHSLVSILTELPRLSLTASMVQDIFLRS
jgi:hypothetical protein